MVRHTYEAKQSVGVIVAKIGKNNDIALLWLPRETRQQQCKQGVQNYQLADWVVYDSVKESVVDRAEPLYQTRLSYNQYVELRVPLIYFSDKVDSQMVVIAYAPGFGRVASFFKNQGIVLDTLYFAWISFMALYNDKEWQKLISTWNFSWVVSGLDAQVNEQEMKELARSGDIPPLSKGIVVERTKEFCTEENENGLEVEATLANKRSNSRLDTASNKSSASTSTDTESNGEPCIAIKLWTPNNNYGTCLHRIKAVGNDTEERYAVGEWCCFLAVKSWSNCMVAVSPFVVKTEKGIELMESEPILKLRFSHELYKFDQDPDSPCIHLPNLLGTLNSTIGFVQGLRRARQRHPLDAPRLVVEYFPTGSGNWKPIDHDERSDSPPPPSRDHKPVQVQRPQTKNEPKTTTQYGFGGRTVPSSSNQSTIQSTSASSASIGTQSTSTTDNTKPEQKPELARPGQKPEVQSVGGFGRSRNVSAPRAAPVPTSAAIQPHQSAFRGRQAHPAQAAQRYQRGETPTTTTCSSRDRPPSVESDFGEDFGDNVQRNFAHSNASPLTERKKQYGQQQRPAQQRRGGTASRGGDRPFSSSAASSSRFVDSIPTSNVKKLKNLYGVVVSKDQEKGFYVWTTSYPKQEIYLPKSRAVNGLKHGSWIKFDLSDIDNGNRLIIEHHVLEPNDYFTTTPIRNTVQIELMIMVPRLWNPNMSTHRPIVQTEWMEEVVDDMNLLDEICANQHLTATVERCHDTLVKWGVPWKLIKVTY